MFLLIDGDPLVINECVRCGNGKTGIDFSADLLEPQHPIVFPVNPNSPAITCDGLLPQSTTLAPSQGLMRKLLLNFILVDDRSPSAQRIRIDHVEFSPTLRLKQIAQGGHVLAR